MDSRNARLTSRKNFREPNERPKPTFDEKIGRACDELYETLIAPGARGPIRAKALVKLKRLVRLFGEQAKTDPGVREDLSRMVAMVGVADQLNKRGHDGRVQ